MTYRRRKDSDAWHWVRSCSQWPKRGYFLIRFKPTFGELCDQCQAKSREREVSR